MSGQQGPARQRDTRVFVCKPGFGIENQVPAGTPERLLASTLHAVGDTSIAVLP